MNDRSPSQTPTIPAVVVTGATEGIGYALAREFARHHHVLLLVARNEQALAKTARELEAAYCISVRFTAQDLSTEEGCAGVEAALKRFNMHCDILVNNAAVMYAGFFQDKPLDQFHRIADLNVRGVVDLMGRFLVGMIERGRGGILNVASVEGFMPVPYQATYAASKAFVISLTRALAYEAMYTGVRISALCPGPIDTAMHAKAGGENSLYVRFFPVMSAQKVARKGYRRFMRGRKMIVPGIFNKVSIIAARLTPNILLMAFMGMMFRVRDANGNVVMPKIEPARRRAAKERAETK